MRLQELTIRMYDDVAGKPYVEITDERYDDDGYPVPGSVSMRVYADKLVLEDLRRSQRRQANTPMHDQSKQAGLGRQ